MNIISTKDFYGYWWYVGCALDIPVLRLCMGYPCTEAVHWISLYWGCAWDIPVLRLCMGYPCTEAVHGISLYWGCAWDIPVLRLCMGYPCAEAVHGISLYWGCALDIPVLRLCMGYPCAEAVHGISLCWGWAWDIPVLRLYTGYPCAEAVHWLCAQAMEVMWIAMHLEPAPNRGLRYKCSCKACWENTLKLSGRLKLMLGRQASVPANNLPLRHAEKRIHYTSNIIDTAKTHTLSWDRESGALSTSRQPTHNWAA